MTTKKKGNRPGTRRVGRTLAFQILYGQFFEEARDTAALDRMIDQNPLVIDEESQAAVDFARELAQGVFRLKDSIDKIVEETSTNWKLDRIARVERAILRLSLYEMLYTDIPLRVVINEAIELSKTFGDENSRGFINGVMDAVARKVEKGEQGVKKEF